MRTTPNGLPDAANSSKTGTLPDRKFRYMIAAPLGAQTLPEGKTVTSAPFLVSPRSRVGREMREARRPHRGMVFWLTGLSGSGKSTLAHRVEESLFAQGWDILVLDGDNIRQGLCRDLGFSSEDRTENNRRVAELARIFMLHGAVCLCAFISPLENNRQNLERTLGMGKRGVIAGNGGGAQSGESRQSRALRSRFFIPVFAWPALFRIRADLGQLYGFKKFADSRDESFSLVTGADGSVVIPEKPFSITDKIPFLKEAGFGRFIIDLSGPVLKKAQYRDLMRAITEGTPLPGISRFNWKDGFFQMTERAGE
jgi:hypothetical protein